MFSWLMSICSLAEADVYDHRVQVNVPAESGEMGILANHVPSIEQLKPGLIEVIEESGGSKQFFCTSHKISLKGHGKSNKHILRAVAARRRASG